MRLRGRWASGWKLVKDSSTRKRIFVQQADGSWLDTNVLSLSTACTNEHKWQEPVEILSCTVTTAGVDRARGWSITSPEEPGEKLHSTINLWTNTGSWGSCCKTVGHGNKSYKTVDVWRHHYPRLLSVTVILNPSSLAQKVEMCLLIRWCFIRSCFKWLQCYDRFCLSAPNKCICSSAL